MLGILPTARFSLVAESLEDRCRRLLALLRTVTPPGRGEGVTELWSEPRGGYEGLAIG